MEGADYFVEGLLDFTNGGTDDMITDAFFQSTDANTHTHTPLSLSDSSNSSVSGSASASHPSFPDSHFSNDLCVPCDELEELEWLSNFVEESFSTEELHKFHLIPTQPTPIQYPNPNPNPNPTQQSPSAVPGKARSKRSRIPPCDWSTRLLMVSTQNPSPATSSSSGQSPSTGPKKPVKRRESGAGDEDGMEVRRCLHCAAEKTPQWRTGPMGPKTLCNACGVRYKSGRLVPEYRPAASPTFVSARHSNSHRKVMELRRQKEVQRPQPPQFIHHQLQQQQQQQQHHHQQQQHHHHHHHGMMMGVSSGGDEYLNYHHLAPDYRQMMS